MTKVFRLSAICTLSVVALLSVLILVALWGIPASAQQTPTQPQVLSNAVANEPIQFDVSRPLTELLKEAPAQRGGTYVTHPPMQPKLQQLTGAQLSQGAKAAGAIQPLIAPLSSISATIGLSFEGVGNTSTLNCPSVAGFTVAPPDTNAAVGDTQVVEWVNVCYAVFDKSTGALIAGPFAGTNFWAGFGAPCETNNDGDIIIQWDKSNHRWLAAQNVFAGPPYYDVRRGVADCRRDRWLLPLHLSAAWLPRLPEVGAYEQCLLPDPKRLRPHPCLRRERLRL